MVKWHVCDVDTLYKPSLFAERQKPPNPRGNALNPAMGLECQNKQHGMALTQALAAILIGVQTVIGRTVFARRTLHNTRLCD